MKTLIQVLTLVLLSACASNQVDETVRTKWTDKGMRIMLDPDSVDEASYIRATTAVVQADKWTVVDRRNGYEAIKKEQDREHRQENDRFENKQKWAQWGKAWGVGSVIVPYADCYLTTNRFTQRQTKHCRLSLTLADASTSEIIVSVEGEDSCTPSETPDWSGTVDKLSDAYPEKFTEFKKSKRIEAYKLESEHIAVIQQQKNEIDSGKVVFGKAIPGSENAK